MSTAPAVVTGAAGFIGSSLVDALLDRGERVVGIDNFDGFYAAAVKRRNLDRAAGHPGFVLEEIDIRDAHAVAHAWRRHKPRQVFHLAAKAGVRPSFAGPDAYRTVNETGTANVLAACAASTVEHVVFTSSSSVYGDSTRLPFREMEPLGRPLSPYAATKAAAERSCAEHAARTGLPVTCLRLFTVYGPRQRPDLAIHRFVRAIDAGAPVTLYGDGSSRRDFTYIEDIVSGILAAATALPGFRVFNIGRGSPVTLADTVRAIESALGKPARIERLPPQPGDLEHTWADVTAAERDLGFAARVPLAEGIRRSVDRWRQEKDGTAACAAPAG